MGKTERKNINLVLDGFKRNDEIILERVYRSVFPKVRAHVLNNSGDVAKAKDVFQEAFVACWQNVKDNKFDGTGNLEAYLFTIAKNKWTDHLRSARFKKTVHQDVIPLIDHEEEEDQENEAQNEHEIMKSAFHQMGNGCKDLLSLFYFERKNMEEIAEKLGIGSASARNKKYRCMEQLRALAQQIKNNG
ncbi:RNA polymerase sigma factor, sigma-70 family [Flagellimonas taeanensis]|jgi:RNA polymerase sigma factor (sigma-70 family)|uniref:RNA polymerase sigma factor, sigma-70 family n=1 Tax=Flagellimonas taeanensis TaxID=1005926 RepID=A0A1M6RA18_9FLAO|nr:sigma-70 family RNA polymerase sigma factor [Allomuricauda taeanensis]SFB74551.1 RNA polymerase sigma factor, sigma-70 family [Allomuricauda taeanensis]SHK29292.1 RNA polymerase sigma factor, sigma-70 family [Allomuricauda taeanensis]